MKKTFITILTILLIVIPPNTFSQTNVSGVIDNNTVWELAGSPFIVTDYVLVDINITLTIEAGVTVQLDNNSYIIVQGEIIAEGTAQDTIVFNPFGKGIHFTDTAEDYDSLYNTGCRISYAKILNPTQGSFGPVLPGGWSNAHFVTGQSSSSSNQQVSISITNSNINDAIIIFTGWGGKLITEKSYFENNLFINGCLEGDNAPNLCVRNNHFINTNFGTTSFDLEHNLLDNCNIGRFYSQLHSYGYNNQYYNFNHNYINSRITKFQQGESIKFYKNTYICPSGNNITGTVNYFKYNNILKGTGYKYVMESSSDLDAEYNYWGTNSLSEVQNAIYDFNDYPFVGSLDVDPILSDPSEYAPAFIYLVSYVPNDTINNKDISIIITFSKTMDTDNIPSIIFGSTSPNDTYIFPSGSWSNSNKTYTTTYTDVSSLPHNTAFTVQVSGAKGRGDYFQIPETTLDVTFIRIHTGQLWHVSISGSDSNDGSSQNPFASIQHAIDQSANGDTILVQPGTYLENINYNGKKIVMGSLYLTTSDKSHISSTIIDGNQNGSVVTFESGEDETVVLSGFTITNGSGTDIESNNVFRGGGILIMSSSPTINRLLITNNNVNGFGGGINVSGYNSYPKIDHSVIKQNNGGYTGGGISIDPRAEEYVSDIVSEAIIINCLIHDNISSQYGAGIAISPMAKANIINTTIVNNNLIPGSIPLTGGVFANGYSQFIINSCILYGNTGYQLGIFGSESEGTISYSDIEEGQSGVTDNGSGNSTPNILNWLEGNIDADPLFFDQANGVYSLTKDSPCIDAGDPNSPLDPDGTIADMGAYFYNQNPPTADFIADNTKGSCPFTVNFTDLSLRGTPEWPIDHYYWDFDGDGIIDSNIQNPSFTYTNPGSYTVTLTINDGSLDDTETKENYILSVGPILFEDAGFSASVFYNNIRMPDGIAVLPDESLLVVNEWSRPEDPGIGVYHAIEGDEFDITDAFSTIGPPFINPDDIIRYSDGRVFVADGQGRTVFKIPVDGGPPEAFVNPQSTGSPNFSPFGLAIAPENFDGPNVDPGDLIIADNSFGNNDKAVWAVNPNTGLAKIIAQGAVFIDGPLNPAFNSNGTLFIFQNNDSGSGRIVILGPDGVVTPFLSGIETRSALAIHPITNMLYFKNRDGEIFKIPEQGGTPELFASNIHGYEDMVFNEAGNKLFMSATTRRQVICITGPFYCSPPTNLRRQQLITSGEIYLEWDVPVDNTPDSYKIYRDNIQIGETGGNNTSFSDFEVVHGTEYQYYVTAYFETEPVGESSPSNKIDLYSIKNVDYLSINNIKSLVYSDGACFNNTDGSSSGFEFPINSEKTLHYFGNIWLGGEYGGELYLAANKYGHFPSVNSFTPGPVADLYDQDFFNDWNQVWKVSKADVDYHKQNFMDVGYQIQYNILNWPAHGDPTKGMAADLAPYIDTDNNGIYEPSMGDYPEIKGDEAIYFIFNDSNVAPNLTGRELKFEYHGMMYAYATVNDMTLSNTIFIQYRIFNRSDLDFDEMKLGYYSDFDLGYAWDDYVGCDEALNSYYAYNDPFDGNGEVYAYGDNPPAIGTVFLSDNMETFITYSNNSGVTGDPSTSSDYWNYLNATWKDGEHIRYGGNGHPSNGSSGDPTNYMYPGNLNNMTEWSELSVGNAPGDRRGLGVISFPLAAGDSYELDIGFVAARDIDGNNITSVDHLKEKIVDLQNKYNMDLLNWSVNPADFEYDGEIIAEVLIDDAPVSYTGGTLGAFVGDQSRGVYKTSRTGPAGKVVFILRCYSNLENGETLSFRYYDPILDITFNINETIDFESDMTVGNAREPVQLHAYTTIDISIPLSQGWTWFSLNVTNENMNIDEALTSLTLNENDYIKNQILSTTYYEGYGWFGNLTEFNNRDMYKILLNQSNILEYTGYAVDPAEVPIEISAGWNWVAYTPQYNLPLSDALISLNIQDLDYIKNQRFSSTYYEGHGWFGTLEELFPNDGYMIKSAESGTLIYPPQSESTPNIISKKNNNNKNDISFFDFNPSLYRFNGSLTAKVLIDGIIPGSTENILFAFSENKCIGQTKGQLFHPTREYVYNLMVYNNIKSGEEITFKFYNSEKDLWYEFEEILIFEADMIEADAYDPFELKNGSILNTKWMKNNGFSFYVYPNPFSDILNISFTNPENQEIKISVYDAYGRKVGLIENKTFKSGYHNIEWNSNNLPNGIYFIRIETNNYVKNQKIIKIN